MHEKFRVTTGCIFMQVALQAKWLPLAKNNSVEQRTTNWDSLSANSQELEHASVGSEAVSTLE